MAPIGIAIGEAKRLEITMKMASKRLIGAGLSTGFLLTAMASTAGATGGYDGGKNYGGYGAMGRDERGRSQVALTAAVDPTKYPTLVVTAELGDGDPAPSNREVLRGTVLT